MACGSPGPRVSVRHCERRRARLGCRKPATFEELIATLSTERRCTAVEMVTQALVDACPASTVRLRGSLATGTADRYSDIDLAWVVPDNVFDSCIAQAPDALALAAPIRRVRMDPDFQRSRKRRLLFVRYVHLPVFWRIDLDIRAESIAADDNYDLDNPQAHGTNWSHFRRARWRTQWPPSRLFGEINRTSPEGSSCADMPASATATNRETGARDVIQLAELCLAAEHDLQPLHQEVVALASSVEAS